MPLRIAVFGVGGAGGRFGASLARAGVETVFVARGEHLRAIRENGLVLETPEAEIRVRPALATDDPREAGPVDVVLLGVKTWQVVEAARAVGPLLGPETFVVPLQNGVEAETQLSGILGAERLDESVASDTLGAVVKDHEDQQLVATRLADVVGHDG